MKFLAPITDNMRLQRSANIVHAGASEVPCPNCHEVVDDACIRCGGYATISLYNRTTLEGETHGKTQELA